MARMRATVPLDTLGNPMPPPVPSGFISRLPPDDFRAYWGRFACEHPAPLPWGPRPAGRGD